MPTKGHDKSKGPGILPREKLREIWAKLTIDDWLGILNEFYPDNDWSQRGAKIKGCCPFHDDRNPSFEINIDKGLYHCFGDACQIGGWNPVRLFADLAKTSITDAIRQLKNRFGIKLPNAYSLKAQQIEDHNDMKRALLGIMNLEFVELAMNPDDPKFAYAKKSQILHWLSEREWPGLPNKKGVPDPEGAVGMWPVGILMPRQRLFERFEEDPNKLKHRDAAYNYLSYYIEKEDHIGSIAFFYFTTPTTVGRIRLRTPMTRTYYVVDDPFDENVGLFGLNMIGHMRRGNDVSQRRVVVVESETDALSVIAHQSATGEDDVVMLATGGGMATSLESISSFGVEECYAVQDNDPAGEGWAKTFIKEGSIKYLFHWTDEDTSPQYKDLDGAVRHHGYPMMRERLLSEDSYLRPHEWLHLLLNRDLAKLPKDDMGAKVEAAGSMGSWLGSDIERKAFVDAVAAQLGTGHSEIMRCMPLDVGTPEGMTERVFYRLGEEYCVLYSNSGSNASAAIWHKQRKTLRTVRMSNMPEVRTMLELDLGPIEDYVRNEFGMPMFLECTRNLKGELVPISKSRRVDQIVDIFRDALLKHVVNAPQRNKLTELEQGVHYIRDFDRGKPAVLVVNGSRFYHGEVQDNKIFFVELDKPSSGNYFFRACSAPWSSFINSADDLNNSDKMTSEDPARLRNVLIKLRDTIAKAWVLKHGPLDAMYLAADTVYTTVASAIGHMTMTEITGDTQSGKTKLMEFIGSAKAGDYRLCEAIGQLDDYSEAGVRLKFTGSRLRLILDEFEQKSDDPRNKSSRADVVHRLLTLFRTLTSGVSYIRGTADGNTVQGLLHFPLTVGGIFTTQAAYDANRFVRVETIKKQGHQDPLDAVRSMLTVEEIVELRKFITLGLISRIPELLDAYQSVKDEFRTNAGLVHGLDTRLKDNLLPSTAILKLAGLDYKEYLHDISAAKMELLFQFGTAKKEHEILWSQLLNTSITLSQHDPNRTGVTSISRLINDPDSYSVLNGLSDLGVYYFPERRWIVVFWERAAMAILNYSNNFRFIQNPGRLKVLADSDPRAIKIKEKDPDTANFMRQVYKLVGSRIKNDEISVFDVSSLLVVDTPSVGLSPEVQTALHGSPLDDEITDDIGGNFDEVASGGDTSPSKKA